MAGEKGIYTGQAVSSIPSSGHGAVLFSASSADVTDAGTGIMTNITGVSLDVVSGKSYILEAFGIWDSFDPALGVAFDLNGGSCGASYVKVDCLLWDGGGAVDTEAAITALSTKAGGAFSGDKATVEMNGSLTCNSSGTLIPRFAVYTAGAGTAKLYKHFWIKLTEI